MIPDRPLLQLQGVSAGYGDLVAVRDVSLAVSHGEVLALLGRNGAGKTTLLKAISGLCRQHAGTVNFDGKDVGSLATHARMALGMGLVQEGKRVFRQRTVEENLVLGGHAAHLKGRDLETALEQAYARFPILGDRRAALAGALSGGQQQMLAIATALMSKPRLLMLDEPSAGLAPSIVSDISDVVKGLRESGLTVLLVEQSVEFALDVADRVVVLDLGRTVFADDASRPDVRGAIRSAYVGGGV